MIAAVVNCNNAWNYFQYARSGLKLLYCILDRRLSTNTTSNNGFSNCIVL